MYNRHTYIYIYIYMRRMAISDTWLAGLLACWPAGLLASWLNVSNHQMSNHSK